MTEPATAADHFASADRMIATARAAWEEEKKGLELHIAGLQVELELNQKDRDRACEARDNALKTTAKLLTQFGIVSQVFEDAKKLAMEAGLYTSTEASLVQEPSK